MHNIILLGYVVASVLCAAVCFYYLVRAIHNILDPDIPQPAPPRNNGKPVSMEKVLGLDFGDSAYLPPKR